MQISHTKENAAYAQVLQVKTDHKSPPGLLKKAFWPFRSERFLRRRLNRVLTRQ